MTGLTFSGGASTGERARWPDTARGIGIILVVYGHALRGLVSAKLLPASDLVQMQDQTIYAFHMPLFFLLSGLFAGRSVARTARESFLRKRLVTIVYPYILWSVLQTLLSFSAHDFANRPGSWSDLERIAWDPIGQFWFLYVLALHQLLLLAPRPILYLLVPVGILLKIEFGGGDMLSRAGGFLPYFAAGVWLTPERLDALLKAPRRAAAALVGGGLLFVAMLTLENAILPSFTGAPLAAGLTLMGLATAAAGITAALGLSRLLDGRIRLLSLLGAASMPIFVLHVIAAAGMRAVLVHLHVHQPVIALFLITAAGLFVPLAIYEAAVRARLAPWLGFGYPAAASTRARRSGGYHPLELAPAKADVGET